jgi:hypothetical protein
MSAVALGDRSNVRLKVKIFTRPRSEFRRPSGQVVRGKQVVRDRSNARVQGANFHLPTLRIQAFPPGRVLVGALQRSLGTGPNAASLLALETDQTIKRRQ